MLTEDMLATTMLATIRPAAAGETVEQIVNVPVLATAPVVTSWRKKSRPVVISVSDPTSQLADPGPLARGRT